jgi:hypothetical protein
MSVEPVRLPTAGAQQERRYRIRYTTGAPADLPPEVRASGYDLVAVGSEAFATFAADGETGVFLVNLCHVAGIEAVDYPGKAEEA